MAVCPSAAVLCAITSTAASSKSGKIKGTCTGLVAQALREWDTPTLDQCRDEFESAIASAALVSKIYVGAGHCSTHSHIVPCHLLRLNVAAHTVENVSLETECPSQGYHQTQMDRVNQRCTNPQAYLKRLLQRA